MRRLAGISLLCILLAAGCRSAPAATATPVPLPSTATVLAPAPTPSPELAPSPLPRSSATAAPVKTVEGDGFAITLPMDWISLRLDASGAAEAFQQFERSNPALATALGGPDALQDAVLWAFAPADERSFSNNLNIRRSPLDGQRIEEFSTVAGDLEEQYRQFSFTILESDAARTIGDLPAAYLHYQYELAAPGAATTLVTGHQYLVAAGGDLWILSFSAGPDSKRDSASVFARIAETFAVVD